MKFSTILSGVVGALATSTSVYLGIPLPLSGLIGLAGVSAVQAGVYIAKQKLATTISNQATNTVEELFKTDHIIINQIKNLVTIEQQKVLKSSFKDILIETLDEVDHGKKYPISENNYVKALVPILARYIEAPISHDMKVMVANQVLDRFITSLATTAGNNSKPLLGSLQESYQKVTEAASATCSIVGKATQGAVLLSQYMGYTKAPADVAEQSSLELSGTMKEMSTLLEGADVAAKAYSAWKNWK